MPTIKVAIYDGRTNQKHEMELPDTVQGQQIIDALIKGGKLQKSDSDGEPLVYDLIAGKKGAIESKINRKTLRDAGIQTGDQLILKTEMRAA